MSYNVIQCLKMSYDVTKCLITSNNVLKVLKCLIECLKTSYHGFTTKSEKFWCRTYVSDQQYDFFVRNQANCQTVGDFFFQVGLLLSGTSSLFQTCPVISLVQLKLSCSDVSKVACCFVKANSSSRPTEESRPAGCA